MNQTPTTVAQLDVEGARRLTERIRVLASNVAENVERLRALVQEAKTAGVHATLGYPSWTAYLKDVFGDEPLRLARDVRQELVAELAAQGMSTRAIAPIVGVHHDTVADDIKAAVGNPTPAEDAPRTVTGLDGKQYPSKSRADVEARWARIVELAAAGKTSHQIAREVGLSEEGSSPQPVRKNPREAPCEPITRYRGRAADKPI